jgi:hypothetical protein
MSNLDEENYSYTSSSTKVSQHSPEKSRLKNTNLDDSSRMLKRETQDDFIMNRLNKDIERDIYITQEKLSAQPGNNRKVLGNTFAFWYKNSEPRIIIGPHCKH